MPLLIVDSIEMARNQGPWLHMTEDIAVMESTLTTSCYHLNGLITQSGE